MWTSGRIAIEIVQVEGDEAIIAIETPAGRFEVMGTTTTSRRVSFKASLETMTAGLKPPCSDPSTGSKRQV